MAVNQRRTPAQCRAKVTFDSILSAAAHILDEEGEAAFTTNRVAEKAGVSIGSLYQYFRDKDDILVALAEREERNMVSGGRLVSAANQSSESALRLGIRSYINLLPNNPEARSKALAAVLNRRGPEEVAKEIDRQFARYEAFDKLASVDRYVLARAITGVVQSAVREGYSELNSRTFENALVNLARGFLKEIPKS